MCILKEFMRFISVGSKTFRDAASGKYDGDSKSVKNIRSEILKDSTASDDCNNLKNDRKNVAGDVRQSFDKLSLNNA